MSTAIKLHDLKELLREYEAICYTLRDGQRDHKHGSPGFHVRGPYQNDEHNYFINKTEHRVAFDGIVDGLKRRQEKVETLLREHGLQIIPEIYED